MSQSSYRRSSHNRDFSDDSPPVSSLTTGEPTSLLDQRLAAEKGFRSPSPGRRFEMASGTGNRLAQEIHDEFLVCKICLEGYKNPKSLNCLHTFCEQCIENHVMSESTYKKYSDYREFTCPLCRKRTQLPIGGCKKLPDNFLVSSLGEVIGRQKPSKFPFCDICKMVNRKHREAVSKCLDCAKLLCRQCVDLHKETKVTAGHSIFNVEIEKDIECKEHQDEVVRFYCEPCETCICVLCTFNEHKDHEITQFGEAVAKYKDNIQQMLDSCKAKIDKFDKQLDSLNKVEDIIKDAEQKIHDTAIQFISDIRTREKQLIDAIKNFYGKELMDYVEGKRDLATTVDGLRSTCNLTEVILKGKDIELLLLKKDVQKKLATLGDIDIKTLPATITKQINFIPGAIDLGIIQDKDRPSLPKMGAKKCISHDGQLTECYDKETQTDNQRARKTTASTIESESETESDEEESESEESEEEEVKLKKPEVKEKEVQTDPPPDKVVEKEAPIETREQGTVTDEIQTEEKGVNTRSRSLQTLSHLRKSPPKENDALDNSLAARRRRRRERAATTHIGYGSLDIPDSPADQPEKHRSRFLYNQSLDNDDLYYDAH